MTEKIQRITACAFLHSHGKVLVAQRSLTKKFMPGIYELPGGHIEFGEGVQDGLVREIKEELGIEVRLDHPYYVFSYTNDQNSCHTVEIMFLAVMASESQPILVREEELAGYAWIEESQLAEYLKENPEEIKAAKLGFELINR